MTLLHDLTGGGFQFFIGGKLVDSQKKRVDGSKIRVEIMAILSYNSAIQFGILLERRQYGK